jgi:NAD(P)-dependent dehydrogenase (short-subunit alcohol dehydrogenase family)
MVVHCGQSFLAPYSASKAALANVTKNAANALRHDRIRVNGINCGWMDTPGEDARCSAATTARPMAGWPQAEARSSPLACWSRPPHVAPDLAAYHAVETSSGVMTGSHHRLSTRTSPGRVPGIRRDHHDA